MFDMLTQTSWLPPLPRSLSSLSVAGRSLANVVANRRLGMESINNDSNLTKPSLLPQI
jgi:hypothetical protein